MKNNQFCHQSFLIGFYVSFVAIMGLSAYLIKEHFVSKESLKTKYVIIDGERYKVEKQ